MSELAGRGVVGVAESYGSGQGFDLRLVAGEKVPALGTAGAAIEAGIELMLDVGENGSLAGIDADGDDVEILADLERQLLGAVQKAVQHFRAQHRALVIDEREDDRLLSKELAQGDGVALLVAKGEVEGKGIAQLLIQPYVAQQRGADAGGLHGRAVAQLSLCRQGGER